VRVITFKIDEELLARIDYVAIKEGVTRSDIIRRALIEYLRRNHQHYPRFRFMVKRVVIA